MAKTQAKGGQGMTQFGRALAELNLEILCANSSQDKGRVERVNRTLQDRLVKELRLAGIADQEAGNRFLPGFMARFNERFATPAARPHDLHRPLNLAPDRLADVLCWREQRHVGQQLAFSYERKRIILEDTDLTRSIAGKLAGKYVDTYAFADGRFGVRWKGLALPYRVFDKDQRVTHAAIVENKRLGDVLAYVKQLQDRERSLKVKNNSEKTGYQRTGRKSPGRKSFVDRMVECRAKEANPAACDEAAETSRIATASPQAPSEHVREPAL